MRATMPLRNIRMGKVAMRSRPPALNKPRVLMALGVGCWVAFQSACLPLALGLGTAPAHKGATVSIALIQGSQKGELIGVKSDALVLARENGDPVVIPLSDIKSVRAFRKPRVLPAMSIGAVVGIPMGVAAAKLSGAEANDMGDAIGKGSLFLLGGMASGAIAGVLVASALNKDETYVLQDKSEREIQEILTQLKKWARVQNYQ
jgi:hypothetical protein